MPSKNVVRNFIENSYYHVFNRGVEKRKIFQDDQDYSIFLYYLTIYIQPLKEVLIKYPNLPIRLHGKNLSSEIELLAYCLMPNHFHLLLRQETISGTTKLLKQLTNAYTFYFNKKYKRVGGLVQGRFKAVEIAKDELLLHISRYIHLNPITSGMVKELENYKWSSYPSYTKNMQTICHKKILLSYFSSKKAYKDFVLDQSQYAKELHKIAHLCLEY